MYTESLQQKIEAYLNGQLSAQERAEFEHEISQSQELAEWVKGHQVADLVLAQEVNKARKARLSEIDREMDQAAVQQQPRQAQRFSLFRRIAVAASLVIAVTICTFLWNQNQNSPALLAQHYYVEATQTLRGGDSADGQSPYDLMKQAQEAFELKQYNLAVEALEDVREGGSMLDETATYNLALVYLAMDNQEVAISMLKTISEDTQHQYQKKAAVLLNKLKVN